MKILHNAEYHAQRDTSAIPNRRPSTPTGAIKLVGTLKVKDDVAFFHMDRLGFIFQSYNNASFRNRHTFYARDLRSFQSTVFNAGWYGRGAFKWATAYKADWLEYVAARSKVTASGYTNF